MDNEAYQHHTLRTKKQNDEYLLDHTRRANAERPSSVSKLYLIQGVVPLPSLPHPPVMLTLFRIASSVLDPLLCHLSSPHWQMRQIYQCSHSKQKKAKSVLGCLVKYVTTRRRKVVAPLDSVWPYQHCRSAVLHPVLGSQC